MKSYVFLLEDLDAPGDTVSPTFTLKALLYETDFSAEEVDTVASLMVGDTFRLDDNRDGYLAVKRVA